MVRSAAIQPPRELAAGIRRGDRAAYETFVEAMSAPLERHAAAVVRDRSAAQDVVQQTFLAVWEGRDRLPEPDGRLRAYCFGIMLNLARKHVHRDRLRAKRETEAASGRTRVDSGRSPAASLVAHEAWEQAQKLAPAVRDVVILRCGIGLTLGETATALGIPAGTVATRQRKGLQQLRERLGVSVGAAIPPVLGLAALLEPLQAGAAGGAASMSIAAAAGSSAWTPVAFVALVAVVGAVAVVLNPFAGATDANEPTPSATPVPTANATPLVVAVQRDVLLGVSMPVMDGDFDIASSVARARAVAALHPRGLPALLLPVSDCLADGTCRFAFPQPGSIGLSDTAYGTLDLHEILVACETGAVRVLFAIDPGNASVENCLSMLYTRFGRHPCVAGVVVRTRWLAFTDSPDGLGRPVTAADAVLWHSAIGLQWQLWLMDWRPDHLPAPFDGIGFLGAARGFADATAAAVWQAEWQERYAHSGFAIGYEEDRRWWSLDDDNNDPSSAQIAAAVAHVPAGGCVIWMHDESAAAENE